MEQRIISTALFDIDLELREVKGVEGNQRTPMCYYIRKVLG